MRRKFIVVFTTGLLVLVCGLVILPLMRGTAQAQSPISVLTVDCTPFVTPGISSIGVPTNTMGMALQSVDQGGDFNVTEATPAAFRAMTSAQLSAYDLIAINNHPARIDCGSGLGLGTTWHSVIGVDSGGRVMLNSHDAPRFKMTYTNPPFNCCSGMNPGPGVEPFGADDIVRQAALWAGGGGQTGLLIFNDAARHFIPGVGWDNPELNLPAAWGISDLDQNAYGGFMDGGYTDILPAYAAHPVYAGLSDARFGVNSISSFAANISDTSFHSAFASYNSSIFTPTEVVVNAGVVDVGGTGCCSFNPAAGPDGTPITLIRDETGQQFVGGVVDINVDSSASLADSADGGSGSSVPYSIVLAGAAAAAAVAITGGALYARRRLS